MEFEGLEELRPELVTYNRRDFDRQNGRGGSQGRENGMSKVREICMPSLGDAEWSSLAGEEWKEEWVLD